MTATPTIFVDGVRYDGAWERFTLPYFGAALGLAIGKPMGIGLTTWPSVNAKIAVLPVDVTPVALLGAAFLCGIGDPLSLLAADGAFPGSAYAGVAKIGVWRAPSLQRCLGC